jgi:acyl carrier protein
VTEQEVFEKLLPLIREVTGVPAERIRMDSNLMDELGAESLDLLDLSFLIEERFGITIAADEFQRQATALYPDLVYEREGLLTDAALVALRQALPEVPANKFHAGMPKLSVPRVLNVAVFVHLIQRKLTA